MRESWLYIATYGRQLASRLTRVEPGCERFHLKRDPWVGLGSDAWVRREAELRSEASTIYVASSQLRGSRDHFVKHTKCTKYKCTNAHVHKHKNKNTNIPWQIQKYSCVGHTAWVTEGRKGRSQGSPKGRQLEVGARRAHRLLVFAYFVKRRLEDA